MSITRFLLRNNCIFGFSCHFDGILARSVDEMAADALIEVISPHGIEGSDIPGHAGHEGGEQGSEREAKQSSRAISFYQRKNYAVVVIRHHGVTQAVIQSHRGFIKFLFSRLK